MCCPAGRNSFRQFLRTEFSEENMLFWLACDEFRKETNKSVVEEKARVIYEDYISILSPKEVWHLPELLLCLFSWFYWFSRSYLKFIIIYTCQILNTCIRAVRVQYFYYPPSTVSHQFTLARDERNDKTTDTSQLWWKGSCSQKEEGSGRTSTAHDKRPQLNPVWIDFGIDWYSTLKCCCRIGS